MFNGLDHIAIVVPNTEEALTTWRDLFGFPVVVQEKVNGNTVLLTHLDLGNTHLQLVEPLTPDHPLTAWLEQHGAGLHHFCLKVADVGETFAELSSIVASGVKPHQGTQGKRALFLDKSQTQTVQVELTDK
jgi:methylmalonyl-CoA/ethylmalonyl-CoA epimerase